MEQKLEDLKTYLNDKFQAQKEAISDIAKDICTSMLKNFEIILKEELDKQNTKILRQNERIEKLESEKGMFQKQVMELKHANIKMQEQIDDNEQYGRRLCLRFDGVPVKEKETSDMVLEDMKNIFEEAGIEIPDNVIDRAHRIGKGYTDTKTNMKCKSIIMRFTTFRHRTIVYRSRNGLVRRGVKVRIDLTKSRHSLLTEANKFIADDSQVKFCYADINCRLKIKWANERFDDSFFSSMDELKEMLINK